MFQHPFLYFYPYADSVVGNMSSDSTEAEATTEASQNIGPEIQPPAPGNPTTDKPEIVPQSPTPEISEPLGDDPKKWQDEDREKREEEASSNSEQNNMTDNRGYNEIREPAPVNPRESDKGTEETEEYPR
jgi:hypothetical protein